MWIKICANTNLKDALLAAESGADAVGFVFAPSKRQVTAQQVSAITSHLPSGLEKIGVFITPDANEIAAAYRASGLTGIQIHSRFERRLVQALRMELGDRVSLTQTIHWKVDGETNNAEELASVLRAIAQEPAVDRVLIDSKNAKGTGGTGISFDWSGAYETLARYQGKLIVAGGLRPDNVVAAIATLKPWGVDVASGVEVKPGKKDPATLSAFIKKAR